MTTQNIAPENSPDLNVKALLSKLESQGDQPIALSEDERFFLTGLLKGYGAESETATPLSSVLSRMPKPTYEPTIAIATAEKIATTLEPPTVQELLEPHQSITIGKDGTIHWGQELRILEKSENIDHGHTKPFSIIGEDNTVIIRTKEGKPSEVEISANKGQVRIWANITAENKIGSTSAELGAVYADMDIYESDIVEQALTGFRSDYFNTDPLGTELDNTLPAASIEKPNIDVQDFTTDNGKRINTQALDQVFAEDISSKTVMGFARVEMYKFAESTLTIQKTAQGYKVMIMLPSNADIYTASINKEGYIIGIASPTNEGNPKAGVPIILEALSKIHIMRIKMDSPEPKPAVAPQQPQKQSLLKKLFG